MYKTNKNIIEPNDNDIIWRYLSLPKFIDFFTSSTLYLSSVIKLPDYYEGKMTNWELVKTYNKEDNIEKLMEQVFVSSWNMNLRESNLLWHTYVGKGKPGIAIQTDVQSLRESIKERDLDYYIGIIRYKESDEEVNEFTIATRKLPEYEFEKEIRLICTPKFNNKPGIQFRIDLNKLIKKLIIYPYEPKWYYDLIFKFIEFSFSDVEEENNFKFKDSIFKRIKKTKIREKSK